MISRAFPEDHPVRLTISCTIVLRSGGETHPLLLEVHATLAVVRDLAEGSAFETLKLTALSAASPYTVVVMSDAVG
jgi:hypothetical protein